MPPPISEIKVKQIERAIANKEGSQAQIAKTYGVSEPTVKRIAKDLRDNTSRSQKKGDRREQKLAIDAVKREAAKELEERYNNDDLLPLLPGTAILDRDRLLLNGMRALMREVEKTPSRSKEGAATALVRLLEHYEKHHPMTTAELVDRALEMPNFDPYEFAAELKRRTERSA